MWVCPGGLHEPPGGRGCQAPARARARPRARWSTAPSGGPRRRRAGRRGIGCAWQDARNGHPRDRTLPAAAVDRRRPGRVLWTVTGLPGEETAWASGSDDGWDDGWDDGLGQGCPDNGATQTATIPGPTCAPSTAPISPHQTSRPSRLAASRSASRPASLRPCRGWPGETRTDRPVVHQQRPRRGAPSGSEPGRRSAPDRGSPLAAWSIRRRGLTDRAPPSRRRRLRCDHRGGGTPRCRRRTAQCAAAARARAASAASATAPARIQDVGGAQRGVSRRHADLSRVDDGDRHRRVTCGKQGRLEVPLISADRWIERISGAPSAASFRTTRSGPPATGARCSPGGTPAAPRPPSRSCPVGALVEHGRPDHDL